MTLIYALKPQLEEIDLLDTKTDITQIFKNIYLEVDKLLENIPQLMTAVPEISGSSCEHDLKLLEQVPRSLCLYDNKPVIAVALAGPSGAGKSTVFNQITGLDVPAGGAVRPMSFASVVALPRNTRNQIDVADLFHGFKVVELTSNAELRSPEAPINRLYCTYYDPTVSQSQLWLCLVDMPDFNTTEVKNWQKAEQMINRADAVIFTVYHESYKDQKTFEILKRCCRLSGNMGYLLTKLDPENAQQNASEIYEDIMLCAAKDPGFASKRADGKSLLEYLQSCTFYYSPYKSKVSLADIMPLDKKSPDFTNFIYGHKGLEIILNRQMESIYNGLKSCQELCELATEKRDKLTKSIADYNYQLEESANHITGTESPVFHVLAMLKKLLEENRPPLLQTILKPISMLSSGLQKFAGSIRASFSKKEIEQKVVPAAKQRDLLERQRLESECELLVDNWRRKIGKEILDQKKCRQAIIDMLKQELPPVDEEWEIFVRQSLQTWFESNRGRWMFMNTVNDLLLVVGTGLVVADIFIDGGIGTLGVVATIGGSGATSGFLLSLFNNMGLNSEILAAHSKWKELRKASYLEHLRQKLALPLFLEEDELRLKRLAPELINESQKSCEILGKIIKQHADP